MRALFLCLLCVVATTAADPETTAVDTGAQQGESQQLSALRSDVSGLKALLESLAAARSSPLPAPVCPPATCPSCPSCSCPTCPSCPAAAAADNEKLDAFTSTVDARLNELEKKLLSVSNVLNGLQFTIQAAQAREARNLTVRATEWAECFVDCVVQLKDWLVDRTAEAAVLLVDGWWSAWGHVHAQLTDPALRKQAEEHATQLTYSAVSLGRRSVSELSVLLQANGVPDEYCLYTAYSIIGLTALVVVFVAIKLITALFTCICSPCRSPRKKLNGKKLKAETAKRTPKPAETPVTRRG